MSNEKKETKVKSEKKSFKFWHTKERKKPVTFKE